MKARSDGFVVLVPTPWQGPEEHLFLEAYEEYWQEPVGANFSDPDGAELTVNGQSVRLHIDAALPELAEFASTALEPFGASDQALLQQHTSIWRLVAEGGRDSAEALLKVVGALVIAGASGAFLPNTRRLHSPRSIRHFTMELNAENLTNFFVGAYDRNDWMRTRGLTAFGLPEVETPTTSGINAAYFRLMDIAAAMLDQRSPFPTSSRIQLGPSLFSLVEGPRGPEDDDIPVNGLHGVISLMPI